MKKLLLTFLSLLFATVSYADHDHLMWGPIGLPVDEQRGPWFATIDLDATEYAWQRVNDVTRKGDTSLRLELRDGDCFTAYPHDPAREWDDCTRDRERSEIREKWYAPLDTSVWYAFSMYIPEDYEPMYPKQIFFQWHGGDWGPNVYFQLNREKFLIDVLTEEHQTTTQYEVGELSKGRWLDFVIQVKWTKHDTGFFILYNDGNELWNYSGPTMDQKTYDIGTGPYVKMGIYRSHLSRWTQDRPHPTHVLYFDEYRRGRTFNEVDVNNYQGD
jgi:hypothetical protein